MANALLLLCEAALYFGAMVGLFRMRKRIGIGVFMCALGVMHFLETYLAGVFYVATPFGMLSPGSTVLFSGKLVMLLLLYIKEDAASVRQPIYGLLLGNALTVGLVCCCASTMSRRFPSGLAPDIGFIDDMGWLMVWGTALLYVDAILIILLYERLGRSFGKALFPRIVVSVACILTFDQIGFFAALHYVTGAPIDVLIGGWAGKMAAALALQPHACGLSSLPRSGAVAIAARPFGYFRNAHLPRTLRSAGRAGRPRRPDGAASPRKVRRARRAGGRDQPADRQAP